jgi:hypothetical protein
MSTPTPPNCSGLANSGVPANAPGDEIPASEADWSSVFARPRSIILAVTLRSSFNLTGTLNPASGFVEAGRLGKLKFIQKDVVLLGDPLIIDGSNVDGFKS